MPLKITGVDLLRQRLKNFEGLASRGIEERLENEVLALQRDTADAVPVETGRARTAIMSPGMIRRTGTPGRTRWTFGFVDRAIQKLTYYLFWVEFGTKGYERGERRFSGRTAQGTIEKKRLKRRVPPRRAQPFFRPAVARAMARLQRGRELSNVLAAAATAAGFKAKAR